MTYKEIIKMLERIAKLDAENYTIDFMKGVFEIIKRQQAEIERLHNILLSFTDEVHTWSNKKGYDTTELSLIPILNKAESVRKAIIAETVKEFAEKLKESLTGWYTNPTDEEIEYVIDKLLKEVVGANNDR